MKKNTAKISFFISLVVLIAGAILLAIPFDYEKFYQESFDYKTFGNGTISGFDGYVEIVNKSDDIFEDVTVEFEYVVGHNYDRFTKTIKLENVVLSKGLNEISFRHQENNYSIYRLEDVNNVKLILKNGKVINVGNGSLFSGSNFYFLGMFIIGVIGSIVSLIAWKVNPKVEERLKEEELRTGKTFEERIKEAFTPIVIEKEVKENKKYVCPYCKVQYDASLDKCPHCGAPPERKD